jgi:hypothetical protein
MTKCALKFQIPTWCEDVEGLIDDVPDAWDCGGATAEGSSVDIIKLLLKGPWKDVGVMDFESAVPGNVLRL